MSNRRKFITLAASLLAAAGVLTSSLTPALANDFPTRPISLIIPFPAGSSSDVIGRFLAAEMEKALPGSVIVENAPGATGTIGGARVATADPDGYTLLFAADQVVATGALKEASYDGTKDFVPITPLTLNYFSLVAGPGMKEKTYEEALAAFKAAPGKFVFGTSGHMGSPHLAAEVFQKRADVKLKHVPYPGTGAITDFVAGRIPLMSATVGQVIGSIKTVVKNPDDVSVLVVYSEERLPALPDTPTSVELGFEDAIVASFTGIFAPVKTPENVVERLRAVISDIVKGDAFKEKMNEIGVIPAEDTSSEALKLLVDGMQEKMISAFGEN